MSGRIIPWNSLDFPGTNPRNSRELQGGPEACAEKSGEILKRIGEGFEPTSYGAKPDNVMRETLSEKQNELVFEDWGLVSYDEGYDLQKKKVTQVLNGGAQTIGLCEHFPVITLGRSVKKEKDWAAVDPSMDVRHVDRGGDVTVHWPGQVVVYPILNLAFWKKDLRAYLSKLEQVAIDFLADFDIVANRFPGRTGVWLSDKKIASIGIGVRRWVTYHGLAINVNNDLEIFSRVKPCGMDVDAVSVASLLGKSVDLKAAQARLCHYLKQYFAAQ